MAQSWARAFYMSKLWQQQRRHALHRDMYSCRDCGGAAEEVHHIVELTPANIEDYSVALGMDNLICLCFDCHQKRHSSDGALPDGFVFDEQGNACPKEAPPPI